MTDESEAVPGADDDGLVVESLEDAEGLRQPSRGIWLRDAWPRAAAQAARARWERPLSGHERLARGALIVTLFAVTLFALLGGPTLTVAGWQWLTFTLRSGSLAPQLVMTDWQPVAPPRDVSPNALTYTADPVAPTTIFACRASASGVEFWRTDTQGQSWAHVGVSQTPAQSCQVKVALDSSLRLLLVVRAPDPQRIGCASMTLYLSPISGYEWAPVSQPPDATGAADCQSDAWASARWIFAWWTDAAQSEPTSHLMASADQGATWRPADGGPLAHDAYLAPALTSYGAGDALLAQVANWPGATHATAQREIVRSVDDGVTWQTLGGAPSDAVLSASLEPRVATVGAWSVVYAPIYADAQLTPRWAPDQPPEAIQALTTSAGVWRKLPPLPINGAAADGHHLGVAATLGVAPSNVLLTLGTDPHNRVTAQADTRDLWLWAWDPTAGKWRLGQQAPPNTHAVGFSWSAGPIGSPYEQMYGVYLWLTGESGGHQTLYDAFIPVPAEG